VGVAAEAAVVVAAADREDPAGLDRRDRSGRLDVFLPCRYLVSCAKSVETTSFSVLKAKNSAGM
jgi:hypothetical protein